MTTNTELIALSQQWPHVEGPEPALSPKAMITLLGAAIEAADRRIAELEAERAATWDEGYTRGFYDREKLSGDSRDASEGASDNPYRKGAPE